MAELDELFGDLAEDLIDQFGGTATLQSVTININAPAGTSTETIVAETVKISPPQNVEIDAIDGTLVQAGDMQTVLARQGLSNVPVANKDRLVFAGETWKIVGVDPIYSGDQVAAYTLNLRR